MVSVKRPIPKDGMRKANAGPLIIPLQVLANMDEHDLEPLESSVADEETKERERRETKGKRTTKKK
jgi:hypothetical protein